MSLKRITISLPDDLVAKAQRAVDTGLAESVSAYFAGLAAREPDWPAAVAAVEEMIAESGPLSENTHQWARDLIAGDVSTGAA